MLASAATGSRRATSCPPSPAGRSTRWSATTRCSPTRCPPGVDAEASLALFGAAGVTAYVGLTDVGKVQEGETVVVSAAAGATGSIAVQIAKILGARVIGIAGTDEKCAWLVDDLGIDGAINHRTDDIPARLKELCPKRVDVFFDNTGGPILEHVLGRIADHARVVLCGAISSYNDHHKPPGPASYLNLIARRARMEGFISWDSWGRFDEIAGILGGWLADGRLHVPHPRVRGARVGPAGPERHVHRREHRQGRHQGLSYQSAASASGRPSIGGRSPDSKPACSRTTPRLVDPEEPARRRRPG